MVPPTHTHTHTHTGIHLTRKFTFTHSHLKKMMEVLNGRLCVMHLLTYAAATNVLEQWRYVPAL